MKPKLILVFLIFNLSFLIEAPATVRYVSKTGSSTPPYTSWATASDSIQKCINICQSGDTVYIANGVYREKVGMIIGLSLIGGGMDSCLIDNGLSTTYDTVVVVKDSCLFKNSRVITSNNYSGIGVFVTGNHGKISSITVTQGTNGIFIQNSNSLIENNFSINNRINIRIYNSNSLVRYNYLSSEFSSDGINISAINLTYIPVIDLNYIESSGESSYGIKISVGSKPIIKNNTIVLRDEYSTGYYGGGTDTAKIFNNVVISTGNSSTGISGFVNTGVPHLTRNNLVIGTLRRGMVVTGLNSYQAMLSNNLIIGSYYGIDNSGQAVSAYYNNTWNTTVKYRGFTADSTNISLDPMLVQDYGDIDSLDFHLQKYSPMIDAGNPNILDRDGSRSDIGLYGGPFGEIYTYLDLAPRPPVNLSALVDTNRIVLSWNRNTEADTAFYKVYRDTVENFAIDSTKLIASPTDTFFVQSIPNKVSKYVYKITCLDKQGNESNPSEEIVVNLTSINDYPMTINDYFLYQNYPNPFNPSTKIAYKLKEGGYVKLYVYDIKGELIEVLVNQNQEGGYYEVDFFTSSKNLASGAYLYQILVKDEKNIPVYSEIKKMIYIK